MAHLKIVLLGRSGVGKTCLVNKLVYGSFNERETTTIGCGFLKKEYISQEGSHFEFAIWDTAGQERFDSLSTFYTRDAGCALILYDQTSVDSFEEINKFYTKLEFADPDCFSFLVGTKSDLIKKTSDRKVTKEEAMEAAKKHGSFWLELSSKTGDGVGDLWEQIGDYFLKLLEAKKKKLKKKKTKRLNEEQKIETKNGCC
ncbi:ras family-domain-containing protein [Anaeramoeba flamelloides]|uniref:Ras family-domain-containing protein n=1 Tax=Anaeramoeba flamelloides TaxID=1746091 RepID=A0AAV7ZAZ3_9EUKA|nr:ras family-domain-containing protein [Anaeramoeba flamelloides]